MAKVQVKILQGMAGVSYTYPKGSLQSIKKAEAERLEKAGIVEIIDTDATQDNSTADRRASNPGGGKGVAKSRDKRRRHSNK